MIEIVSSSLEQTEQFAAKLAQFIQPPTVMALVGELGSGKTTFLKSFCKALGVTDEVISPTFVLEQIYQGKFPIYHYDWYRLENFQEAYELGVEEKLPPSQGLAIIEWANRFPELLPEEYYLLRCDIVDDHSRKYILTQVKMDEVS